MLRGNSVSVETEETHALIPLLYLNYTLNSRLSQSSNQSSEILPLENKISETNLARYRWILGHQTLALLMQAASRELFLINGSANLRGKTSPSEQLTLKIITLFSSLLHYTVSWTREIYNTSLRPEMLSIHPCFSGLWWREVKEFKVLLDLLQEDNPKVYRKVGEAYGRFWKSHGKIKSYSSVESSLYQQNSNLLNLNDRYEDYFDLYFRIIRTTSTIESFLSQLIDRFVLIEADLKLHGTFKDSPLGPLSPEVFTSNLKETVAEITFAVGKDKIQIYPRQISNEN